MSIYNYIDLYFVKTKIKYDIEGMSTGRRVYIHFSIGERGRKSERDAPVP